MSSMISFFKFFLQYDKDLKCIFNLTLITEKRGNFNKRLKSALSLVDSSDQINNKEFSELFICWVIVTKREINITIGL